MLKTRVITALVLFAIVLAIAFSGSFHLLAATTMVVFAAAAWESFRLFGNKNPLIGAAIWTAAYAWIIWREDGSQLTLLYALCAAIWAFRLVPSLVLGLPPLDSMGNRLLNGMYGVAIFGCFTAMMALFKHSSLYLFSVLMIVWIADTGAYFSGKAFGKHKLAPSISPGKTWEGAVGGAVAVFVCAAISVAVPALSDSFPARLQVRWGWLGFAAVLALVVAASIVGDLFESQLKRRAGMKDSGNLLPGHGGVLDRIDALIPALALAALFDTWL